MAWRLAQSLAVLRDEVDAAYPHRDKSSDGTIGDAAHASRTSDHNPNAAGVVRAWDKTAFPQRSDEDAYCEHIIRLAQGGHPALRSGAYVISNGRIATANKGWAWEKYDGQNPHDHHTHLSACKAAGADGYDALAGWAIGGHIAPPPAKDKVMPAYNPPIQMPPIVDSVVHPDGGGAVLLGNDGSFWTYPNNGTLRGFRGMNGTPDFIGRTAATLKLTDDPSHPLEIVDTADEKYRP